MFLIKKVTIGTGKGHAHVSRAKIPTDVDEVSVIGRNKVNKNNKIK